MEISFNPSNIPDPAANQSVARRAKSSSVSTDTSFSTDMLKQSMKNLPSTSPGQIERARALVADVKYPPTEVLDRIASLLALHLKH